MASNIAMKQRRISALASKLDSVEFEFLISNQEIDDFVAKITEWKVLLNVTSCLLS